MRKAQQSPKGTALWDSALHPRCPQVWGRSSSMAESPARMMEEQGHRPAAPCQKKNKKIKSRGRQCDSKGQAGAGGEEAGNGSGLKPSHLGETACRRPRSPAQAKVTNANTAGK